MDLLLAHPYFLAKDPRERKVMTPYPPLGLLYLSSHLKARGFSVGVFDGTFQRPEDFDATLLRERPSIVGFYCNLMTKAGALRLFEACRRIGATIVVGGPDPANHAEAYLAHGADVVVVGEGEVTLDRLLPRLVARPGARDLADIDGLVFVDEEGGVVRTAPRAHIQDLDSQPLPDREAIDLDAYLMAWRRHHGRGALSLITARGCAYTCRWCSHAVYGTTHRRRSPAHVVNEVERLVARYRPDTLWYADDVFTIHRGWVLAYEGEMRRRGLRVPFECISRAERIDESVADALASLGCFRLWIGSESGSQRVLDAMSRRVRVEQVQHATRLLQARGIQVGLFIMLGYAGEAPADLEATVEHLKRTSPDVFLTTVAYPLKGTPFHDEMRGRLVARRPWAASTDRDVEIAGRPRRAYYTFARRWMTSEVAAHQHWQRRRYARALRSLASARVGRLGMTLFAGPMHGCVPGPPAF